MRSLGTRRVAQAAGAAMVAVIALAGCSAGQVAETAILKAPVSGLDTQTPDGGLLIRNLQVAYNNPDGYKPGESAPLEVSLFNQTEQPMTVLISSKPQQSDTVVSAEQIGVGPATPASAPATTEPTPDPSASGSAPASAEPTAPALQPARFTIAPLGSKTFLTGDDPTLVASKLSGVLLPGLSLSLTFEVDGTGQSLDVLAPFAVPTSPASRAPGVEGENSEE
jgi:hypothetical protein